jgi:hypothetical protein
MGVTGYVGLMGSGKTRRVVKAGLQAQAEGREIFANFRLGGRHDGYMVPMCRHFGCGHFDREGPHDRANTFASEPTSYRFARREAIERVPSWRAMAVRDAWRRGDGFIAARDANLLTSWSQLEALRVHRDELGVAHRVKVVELGEDDKGNPVYDTARACAVYDCPGCSKGITVLIDELNLWAPSRLWAELGIGVLQRWAYARKDGLDIVWSAQHEARVDKVAREVTEHIWSCTAIGGAWPRIRLRLQIFHRVRWIPALLNDVNRTNPEEGARGGGLVDHAIHSETDYVFRVGRKLGTRDELAYDTYEHVAPSRHLSGRSAAKRAEAASGAAAGAELVQLPRRRSGSR